MIVPREQRRIIRRIYDLAELKIRNMFDVPNDETILDLIYDKPNSELILKTLKDCDIEEGDF